MNDIELYDPYMTKCETEQSYIYIEGRGLRPVTYEICGDLAIFEGDIILGDLDTMQKMNQLVASYSDRMDNKTANKDMIERACLINTSGKWWPKLIIPYEIDNAENITAISEAIAYVNKYTPIKLIKRKKETDYVSFKQSAGNSSSVGRRGGKQNINISNTAKMGNVTHEVFHAAGLWHEHSRSDRDNYVTIDLTNLRDPNRQHNFKKHTDDGINLGPYDYGSIMHYSEKAFAKQGTKTIIPKKPGVVIGQRESASDRDKSSLVYMYVMSKFCWMN
jgi:astacin